MSKSTFGIMAAVALTGCVETAMQVTPQQASQSVQVAPTSEQVAVIQDLRRQIHSTKADFWTTVDTLPPNNETFRRVVACINSQRQVDDPDIQFFSQTQGTVASLPYVQQTCDDKSSIPGKYEACLENAIYHHLTPTQLVIYFKGKLTYIQDQLQCVDNLKPEVNLPQ